MSIKTASIPVGATYSPSGGSATGLLELQALSNGLKTVLDDSSEYIDQTSLNFTTKEPKVSASAPNGYTQQRCVMVANVPLSLDNGNRTVNSIRVEVACDIETTDAEKASLRELAIHALVDTDFQDFWNSQSLS